MVMPFSMPSEPLLPRILLRTFSGSSLLLQFAQLATQIGNIGIKVLELGTHSAVTDDDWPCFRRLRSACRRLVLMASRVDELRGR